MYMFYFTEIFGLVHLFCHESVKEAIQWKYDWYI